MVEVTKKFVTDEYHEGQIAYQNGSPLTSNPYLSGDQNGAMWYWIFGWQDAMAQEVQQMKHLLLNITRPIDKETMQ